jgi:hypothetical protein
MSPRALIGENLLYDRGSQTYDSNGVRPSGFRACTLFGRRRLKRKIRRAIEISMPLLGMGIIFGSVLFGPPSLQSQVFLVLIGVLILEAGVWGLTSGLLPNERRYLELRAEGDHFLGLIRILNQAAVGRDKDEENDTRFRNTRAEMHTSVERMGELAGKDAFAQKDPFMKVETVVIEAAEVALAKSKKRAKQTATEETPAEPNEAPAGAADREMDPATPNA